MTVRKPLPRINDISIPDYYAICSQAKAVLLSLDRTAKFEGCKGPPPPLPDIIAESKAEAYAAIRMERLEEAVTPAYTAAQVADQIKSVKQAASELVDALWATRGEAIEALNAVEAEWDESYGMRRPTLAQCKQMAGYLKFRAENAKPKEKSGLSTKDRLARLAAADFDDITGKEPDRSSKRGGVSGVPRSTL